MLVIKRFKKSMHRLGCTIVRLVDIPKVAGSKLKLLLAIKKIIELIIVLYCIVLYCIVLYCIVLYCIVLYCIVLYCIVLYFVFFML